MTCLIRQLTTLNVGACSFFVSDIGLGFVALQTLNYYGYVKVDHGQLQKDFSDFLDLNKDGKVDAEDGKAIYNHTLKVLEFNLPAGGGFAAGFLGGLRTG